MTTPVGSRSEYDALGLGTVPEPKRTSLGQEEFLSLMTTQLKNQDPFKPLESGEFLGQLAQFGTVNGLAELKTSFADLAGSLVPSQKLAAADLLGRTVLATGEQLYLDADGTARGAIEVPQATENVRLQIRDAAGTLVRELGLGGAEPGLVRFEWDGMTDDGTRAEAGRYEISAQYFDGKEMRGAVTFVGAPVESVRFGARGISLSLGGVGEVPFAAVQEIG